MTMSPPQSKSSDYSFILTYFSVSGSLIIYSHTITLIIHPVFVTFRVNYSSHVRADHIHDCVNL